MTSPWEGTQAWNYWTKGVIRAAEDNNPAGTWPGLVCRIGSLCSRTHNSWALLLCPGARADKERLPCLRAPGLVPELPTGGWIQTCLQPVVSLGMFLLLSTGPSVFQLQHFRVWKIILSQAGRISDPSFILTSCVTSLCFVCLPLKWSNKYTATSQDCCKV